MAETDETPTVGEKLMLMVGLAVAAAVAQRVVKVGWVVATGSKPPEDPGDPGVQLGEALTVAALTAVTAAVLRTMVSRRVLARRQRRALSAA